MLTAEQRATCERDGYLVASGLFSAEECSHFRDHYMAMRATGPLDHDFAGVDLQSEDPLKRYPRMAHMHRWDELTLRWLVDPRLAGILTGLLGQPPLAVQTMLYFKPPGARGQALHQDNFYLRVHPGTCLAAWLALDDCDEENGCMLVVPGSHNLPILCTRPADTRLSFTDIEVPIPEGVAAVPVLMQAGDVLFFNGSLIHGSYPNTSPARFRRALIAHYVGAGAERIAEYYDPLIRMDGTEIRLARSEGGGPCGVWVDRDGRPVVEMAEA